MAWQPLLEGACKDRARESLHAIVDALAAREPDAAGEPSLADGTAGLAVLRGYLAQTVSGPDQAVARCLNDATNAVANHPTAAALYGGLTGVGWALAHLQGRLPSLDMEETVAEIDDTLLDHLDRPLWEEDFDLIRGLVGFGVYALERLPRPTAATVP